MLSILSGVGVRHRSWRKRWYQ